MKSLEAPRFSKLKKYIPIPWILASTLACGGNLVNVDLRSGPGVGKSPSVDSTFEVDVFGAPRVLIFTHKDTQEFSVNAGAFDGNGSGRSVDVVIDGGSKVFIQTQGAGVVR